MRECYSQGQFAPPGAPPGSFSMHARSVAGALPSSSGAQVYTKSSHWQFPVHAGPNQVGPYRYRQGVHFTDSIPHQFSTQQPPPHLWRHLQSNYPCYVGVVSGPQLQSMQIPDFQISQGTFQNLPGHQQPQLHNFLRSRPPFQFGTGYIGDSYLIQPMRVERNIRTAPADWAEVARNSSFSGIAAISPTLSVAAVTGAELEPSTSSSSLMPRGPPQRPKQSGHTLWVGNVPPGAHIIALRDHFFCDPDSAIESVFLISKSNCAFVNYRTHESCQAALTTFNDSRFQGFRLVCRLRRGCKPGEAPIQPAHVKETVSNELYGTETTKAKASTRQQHTERALPEKAKERFFVVKSLTVEDLERSVRSGVWATQAHNEVALSRAYETAQAVYLIFSANKSGGYFGYARMDSDVGDNEAAAKFESPATRADADFSAATLTTSTTARPPNPADASVTIITPRTEIAPQGRLVDDSSRGTIFWEADSLPDRKNIGLSPNQSPSRSSQRQATGLEDSTPTGPGKSLGSINSDEDGNDHIPSIQSWAESRPLSFGKPFKITWQSTEQLPFYRTQGLRNPWNANQEVKIARDGTEIEPRVGRKLLNLFGTRGSGLSGNWTSC